MSQHKITSFEGFIGHQTEIIAEWAILLDDLFLSYPNVSRKMRFNVPFYDYSKWICYLNPLRSKKDAVELVFLQGRSLMEHFPILKNKGRKMVAGVEINRLNDELVAEIISIWEFCLSENHK